MGHWVLMVFLIMIRMKLSMADCTVPSYTGMEYYMNWYHNYYYNSYGYYRLAKRRILNTAICDNFKILTNHKNYNILIQNVSISSQLKILEPRNNYGGDIDIEMVSIRHVGLEKVSEGCFSGLNIRNTLNLTQNALQDIDQKVFDNLIHLKVLDMSYNEINSIHPEAFVKNKKLTSLYLNDNKLKTLKAPIFNTQTQLNVLDVSNNPIEYYDNSLLLNAKQLKILSLTNLELNNFSVSPECEFQELYLRGNKFSKLGEHSCSQVKYWTFVDLSMNGIESLESVCFQNMISLEKINLSYNNIQEIANQGFTSKNKLNYLDLSFNNFREINNNFKWNLNGLKKLHMDGGYANLTGTVFFEMSTIFTTLSLSHNYLIKVDSQTFKNLTLLNHLDLSDNSISLIHHDGFMDLQKLTVLNLRNNRIKDIPSTLLRNTVSLQQLDLSQNNLTDIKTGFFDSCHDLLLLNLSHNHLSNISKYVLYPLKNLEELYVHNNDLITIDGFTYLNHLAQISLHNNNWDCDKLFKIIEILDSKSTKVIGVSPSHTDKHLRMIGCHSNKVKESTTDVPEPTNKHQNYENLTKYMINRLDNITEHLKNVSIILKPKENYSLAKSSDKNDPVETTTTSPLRNQDINKNLVTLFYVVIFIGLCILTLSVVNVYIKFSKTNKPSIV